MKLVLMTQPTNKLAAREIDFLRTKSETDTTEISEPAVYLSDMLLSETPRTKAFKQRIEKTKIPEDRFMCALFKIPDTGQAHDDDRDSVFEDSFYIVIDQKGGIWEKVDDHVYAIAFWNYKDRPHAEKILKSLKNNMSNALGTGICAGVAPFPFLDFSKQDLFDTAVKATDHAAFFGVDALVFADAVTFNISGDRLFHIGRIEQAALEYQKGLEIDAGNPNLINSLGVCYGVMTMLEKAREQFQKVIDLTSNDVIAIYNLGLVHNLENEPEKSIACLKKANSINSAIYEVELLLGTLLFKNGDAKRALFHLQKAAELKPESGTPLKTMGEIYLDRGQVAEAAASFYRAVKLNPADAFSMSGLARAYEIQNKNLDIALTFAKKSVSFEPDNSVYRKRLAKIYLKKEQHDLAQAEFEKASAGQAPDGGNEPLKKAAE